MAGLPKEGGSVFYLGAIKIMKMQLRGRKILFFQVIGIFLSNILLIEIPFSVHSGQLNPSSLAPTTSLEQYELLSDEDDEASVLPQAGAISTYAPCLFPARFRGPLKAALEHSEGWSPEQVNFLLQNGAAGYLRPSEGVYLRKAQELFGEDLEARRTDTDGIVFVALKALPILARVLKQELNRPVSEHEVYHYLILHEDLEISVDRDIPPGEWHGLLSQLKDLERKETGPPVEELLHSFQRQYAYPTTSPHQLLREMLVHLIAEGLFLGNPLRILTAEGERKNLDPDVAEALIRFAFQHQLISRMEQGFLLTIADRDRTIPRPMPLRRLSARMKDMGNFVGTLRRKLRDLRTTRYICDSGDRINQVIREIFFGTNWSQEELEAHLDERDRLSRDIRRYHLMGPLNTFHAKVRSFLRSARRAEEVYITLKDNFGLYQQIFWLDYAQQLIEEGLASYHGLSEARQAFWRSTKEELSAIQDRMRKSFASNLNQRRGWNIKHLGTSFANIQSFFFQSIAARVIFAIPIIRSEKFLFSLGGQAYDPTTEFVFTNLFYREVHNRTILCLPVQIGCSVSASCKMCDIGGHFVRNLTAEEMAILFARGVQYGQGYFYPDRYSPVELQFLEGGEPGYNKREVIKAIRLLKGLFPNVKPIISTIGVQRGLEDFVELAREVPDLGIQVSVHLIEDEARRAYIPDRGTLSLEEIRRLGQKFYDISGNKMYLNFNVVSGLNDDDVFWKRVVEFFPAGAFHITLSQIVDTVSAAEHRISSPSRRRFHEIRRFLERHGFEVSLFWAPPRTHRHVQGCGRSDIVDIQATNKSPFVRNITPYLEPGLSLSERIENNRRLLTLSIPYEVLGITEVNSDELKTYWRGSLLSPQVRLLAVEENQMLLQFERHKDLSENLDLINDTMEVLRGHLDARDVDSVIPWLRQLSFSVKAGEVREDPQRTVLYKEGLGIVCEYPHSRFDPIRFLPTENALFHYEQGRDRLGGLVARYTIKDKASVRIQAPELGGDRSVERPLEYIIIRERTSPILEILEHMTRENRVEDLQRLLREVFRVDREVMQRGFYGPLRLESFGLDRAGQVVYTSIVRCAKRRPSGPDNLERARAHRHNLALLGGLPFPAGFEDARRSLQQTYCELAGVSGIEIGLTESGQSDEAAREFETHLLSPNQAQPGERMIFRDGEIASSIKRFLSRQPLDLQALHKELVELFKINPAGPWPNEQAFLEWLREGFQARVGPNRQTQLEAFLRDFLNRGVRSGIPMDLLTGHRLIRFGLQNGLLSRREANGLLEELVEHWIEDQIQTEAGLSNYTFIFGIDGVLADHDRDIEQGMIATLNRLLDAGARVILISGVSEQQVTPTLLDYLHKGPGLICYLEAGATGFTFSRRGEKLTEGFLHERMTQEEVMDLKEMVAGVGNFHPEFKRFEKSEDFWGVDVGSLTIRLSEAGDMKGEYMERFLRQISGQRRLSPGSVDRLKMRYGGGRTIDFVITTKGVALKHCLQKMGPLSKEQMKRVFVFGNAYGTHGIDRDMAEEEPGLLNFSFGSALANHRLPLNAVWFDSGSWRTVHWMVTRFIERAEEEQTERRNRSTVSQGRHQLTFSTTDTVTTQSLRKIRKDLLESDPSLEPFVESICEIVSSPMRWEGGAALRRIEGLSEDQIQTITRVLAVLPVKFIQQLGEISEREVSDLVAEQTADLSVLLEGTIPAFVMDHLNRGQPITVDIHLGIQRQVEALHSEMNFTKAISWNGADHIRIGSPRWFGIEGGDGSLHVIVTEVAGYDLLFDLIRKLKIIGVGVVNIYDHHVDHFGQLQQVFTEIRDRMGIPLDTVAIGRRQIILGMPQHEKQAARKLYERALKESSNDFQGWVERSVPDFRQRVNEQGITDIWERLIPKLNSGRYDFAGDSDLALLFAHLGLLKRPEVEELRNQEVSLLEDVYSVRLVPMPDESRQYMVTVAVPFGDQAYTLAEVLKRMGVKRVLFFGESGFLNLELKEKYGLRQGDLVVPKVIEDRKGHPVLGIRLSALGIVEKVLEAKGVPYRLIDLTGPTPSESSASRDSSTLFILLTRASSVSSYLDETKSAVRYMVEERGSHTVDMEMSWFAQSFSGTNIEFIVVSHITDFVASPVKEEQFHHRNRKAPWLVRNLRALSDIAIEAARLSPEESSGISQSVRARDIQGTSHLIQEVIRPLAHEQFGANFVRVVDYGSSGRDTAVPGKSDIDIGIDLRQDTQIEIHQLERWVDQVREALRREVGIEVERQEVPLTDRRARLMDFQTAHFFLTCADPKGLSFQINLSITSDPDYHYAYLDLFNAQMRGLREGHGDQAGSQVSSDIQQMKTLLKAHGLYASGNRQLDLTGIEIEQLVIQSGGVTREGWVVVRPGSLAQCFEWIQRYALDENGNRRSLQVALSEGFVVERGIGRSGNRARRWSEDTWRRLVDLAISEGRQGIERSRRGVEIDL